MLKHKLDDDYIERAELELGALPDYPFEFIETDGGYEIANTNTPEEKIHSRLVYDRSTELEKFEWKELWDILRGQDSEDFRKLMEQGGSKNDGLWEKWYDGSGMDCWWD